MIKQTLSGALVLIVFLFPYSTYAFDNEPKGFRGIPWWTHISELPEMRLLDDTEPVGIYVRDNDSLEIGGAKVEDIWYGFHMRKFYKVTIQFISKNNYVALERALLEAFGAGYAMGHDKSRYFWSGMYVTNKFINYSTCAIAGT